MVTSLHEIGPGKRRSDKINRLVYVISIIVTAIIVCFCLLLLMVITSAFARAAPPGEFFSP